MTVLSLSSSELCAHNCQHRVCRLPRHPRPQLRSQTLHLQAKSLAGSGAQIGGVPVADVPTYLAAEAERAVMVIVLCVCRGGGSC